MGKKMKHWTKFRFDYKIELTKTKNDLVDETIYCFDIETTSGFVKPNGEIIPFDKNKDKDYYKLLGKVGLCYIWQFSINNEVIYGRTLEEFKEFWIKLEKYSHYKKIIWVHNFAFEFQWLCNIFEWDENPFARKAHKVMYAVKGYTQFRCTYFLTRLSLESWGKQHGGTQKLKGDLDYNVIRTPLTNLTSTQLGYCENDCLVMYDGLKIYKQKYKSLHKIPLTQTGEVRTVVKRKYYHDKSYHDHMTSLLPKDAQMYKIFKACFSGGYTHANYLHADEILDNVHSYDIASSYPYQLVFAKYPSTPFIKTDTKYFDTMMQNPDKACIMKITFKGVKSINPNTYISYNKCIGKPKRCLKDNGRVRKAEELTMYITDVDYNIIHKAYSIDSETVEELYTSKLKYLDKKYVLYVLELFANKTQLKGKKGFEDIYQQAKQFINSMYGMQVTDIVNHSAIFNNVTGEWKTDKGNINEILAELRSKPEKNFLAYQHGLYVTAYARQALWTMILKIGKDVVYCDTDSVKYIGDYDYLFEEYNRQIIENAKVSLTERGIDVSLFQPVSPKGKVCTLGIYEKEHDYTQFITQGAKRYAFYKTASEVDKDDEEDYEGVHITVSGVNKKAGKQLKTLNEFREGVEFDYDHCKKTIMYYISDQQPITWRKGKYDEYTSTNRYSIVALPTTYKMTRSKDYRRLVSGIRSGKV